MMKVGIILLFAVSVYAENEAIVKLTGPSVSGLIKFTQTEKGVTVKGEIKGLSKGKHGFHVHQKGDLTDGCTSTAGHFNPYNKKHGAPTAAERHVGDLGNIEANELGVANVDIFDSLISLTGTDCIVGRAVVVHSDEDDLGLGGHEDSTTTGHAGSRVACGVIGILSDKFDFGKGSAGTTSSFSIWTLITFSLLLAYIKCF